MTTKISTILVFLFVYTTHLEAQLTGPSISLEDLKIDLENSGQNQRAIAALSANRNAENTRSQFMDQLSSAADTAFQRDLQNYSYHCRNEISHESCVGLIMDGIHSVNLSINGSNRNRIDPNALSRMSDWYRKTILEESRLRGWDNQRRPILRAVNQKLQGLQEVAQNFTGTPLGENRLRIENHPIRQDWKNIDYDKHEELLPLENALHIQQFDENINVGTFGQLARSLKESGAGRRGALRQKLKDVNEDQESAAEKYFNLLSELSTAYSVSGAPEEDPERIDQFLSNFNEASDFMRKLKIPEDARMEDYHENFPMYLAAYWPRDPRGRPVSSEDYIQLLENFYSSRPHLHRQEYPNFTGEDKIREFLLSFQGEVQTQGVHRMLLTENTVETTPEIRYLDESSLQPSNHTPRSFHAESSYL